MSSSRAFSGKVADFSGSKARQFKTSRLLNVAAALVLLALPLALSACASFRPVYGDNGLGTESIALAYAKPDNRLEQIVYQSLALRLGKATRTDAPLVTVSVTQE